MRSTPISYALALAAALLSASSASPALAQNRGQPAPPPVPQITPPVPGAGQVRTAPPQTVVTPMRAPTPQTSSPAGLPVPGAGSITIDGTSASPASPSTNATPNADWIQQLIALQYSSALYNSLASAANQLPPGSDPNVVASQMASAQQTAVANWFNNGAEATSVPAADSKAGAYFSNGASVMSVPTDQGQNSWYTNGASVTSVPTGDQRGAAYFSNGGQATSVPSSVPPVPPVPPVSPVPAPAATPIQSALPEAGVSAMPVVVDPNAAPTAPDDATLPSDQSGAPIPAAAPVDTSTTTTGAIVPSGGQAANGEPQGNVQNTVIATAVSTTPGEGAGPQAPATNAASGAVANVAAPRWQGGGMLDESRDRPSSDAVQRPFMGFRILVALFGVAVMVALLVGRLVARRSRARNETARSLV